MAHRIDRSADFGSVTQLLESNACTPEPDGDFFGLLLNAPLEVSYDRTKKELDPEDSNFMICGLARLPMGALGLGVEVPEAVLFLATDTRTHTTYLATIESIPNAEPPPDFPDPGIVRPDPSRVIVTSYFNMNFVERSPLPAVDADYHVHATLGPYRSNVLEVKVRKRGGGSSWPT